MLDESDSGDKQTANSHGAGNATNYIIKDGLTSKIALILAFVGIVIAVLLILILPALGVYLREHRHQPFVHPANTTMRA